MSSHLRRSAAPPSLGGSPDPSQGAARRTRPDPGNAARIGRGSDAPVHLLGTDQAGPGTLLAEQLYSPLSALVEATMAVDAAALGDAAGQAGERLGRRGGGQQEVQEEEGAGGQEAVAEQGREARGEKRAPAQEAAPGAGLAAGTGGIAPAATPPPGGAPRLGAAPGVGKAAGGVLAPAGVTGDHSADGKAGAVSTSAPTDLAGPVVAPVDGGVATAGPGGVGPAAPVAAAPAGGLAPMAADVAPAGGMAVAGPVAAGVAPAGGLAPVTPADGLVAGPVGAAPVTAGVAPAGGLAAAPGGTVTEIGPAAPAKVGAADPALGAADPALGAVDPGKAVALPAAQQSAVAQAGPLGMAPGGPLAAAARAVLGAAVGAAQAATQVAGAEEEVAGEVVEEEATGEVAAETAAPVAAEEPVGEEAVAAGEEAAAAVIDAAPEAVAEEAPAAAPVEAGVEEAAPVAPVSTAAPEVEAAAPMPEITPPEVGTEAAPAIEASLGLDPDTGAIEEAVAGLDAALGDITGQLDGANPEDVDALAAAAGQDIAATEGQALQDAEGAAAGESARLDNAQAMEQQRLETIALREQQQAELESTRAADEAAAEAAATQEQAAAQGEAEQAAARNKVAAAEQEQAVTREGLTAEVEADFQGQMDALTTEHDALALALEDGARVELEAVEAARVQEKADADLALQAELTAFRAELAIQAEALQLTATEEKAAIDLARDNEIASLTAVNTEQKGIVTAQGEVEAQAILDQGKTSAAGVRSHAASQAQAEISSARAGQTAEDRARNPNAGQDRADRIRAQGEARAKEIEALAARNAEAARAAAATRCLEMDTLLATQTADLTSQAALDCNAIDYRVAGQLRMLGSAELGIYTAFDEVTAAIDAEADLAKTTIEQNYGAMLLGLDAEMATKLQELELAKADALLRVESAAEADLQALKDQIDQEVAAIEAEVAEITARWQEAAVAVPAAAAERAAAHAAAVGAAAQEALTDFQSECTDDRRALKEQVDRTITSIVEDAAAAREELFYTAEAARVEQGSSAQQGLLDLAALTDTTKEAIGEDNQKAILDAEIFAEDIGLEEYTIDIGSVTEGSSSTPQVRITGKDGEYGLASTWSSGLPQGSASEDHAIQFGSTNSTSGDSFKSVLAYDADAGSYDVATTLGTSQQTGNYEKESNLQIGAHFGGGEESFSLGWGWQAQRDEGGVNAAGSSESTTIHLGDRVGVFHSTYTWLGAEGDEGVGKDDIQNRRRTGAEGGVLFTQDGFEVTGGGYYQGQGAVVSYGQSGGNTSVGAETGWGKYTVGLGGTWGEDTWGVNAKAGVGPYSARAGFTVVDDKEVNSLLGEDAAGQDARALQLFNERVASFGYSDALSFNAGVTGQAGIVTLGAGISHEHGSQVQFLQTLDHLNLPPEATPDLPAGIPASVRQAMIEQARLDWIDANPQEFAKLNEEASSAQVEDVDELSDINPLDLQDGQGWAFSDYAGNGANGTLGLYGVGVNLGFEEKNVHEITLARTGDVVSVDVLAMDEETARGGLSVLGALNMDGSSTSAMTERVRFDIDVSTPDGQAALVDFTSTGFLPGAVEALGDSPQEQEIREDYERLQTLRQLQNLGVTIPMFGMTEEKQAQQIAALEDELREKAGTVNQALLQQDEGLPSSTAGATYDERQNTNAQTSTTHVGLLGWEMFSSMRREQYHDLYYMEGSQEEIARGYDLATEEHSRFLWWGKDEELQLSDIWLNPRNEYGGESPVEMTMGAYTRPDQERLEQLQAMGLPNNLTNDPMIQAIMRGEIDPDAMGDLEMNMSVSLQEGHLDLLADHLRATVLNDPSFWLDGDERSELFELTDNDRAMYPDYGYSYDSMFGGDHDAMIQWHKLNSVDAQGAQEFMEEHVREGFAAELAEEHDLDPKDPKDKAAIEELVDEQLALTELISDYDGSYNPYTEHGEEKRDEAFEANQRMMELQAEAMHLAADQLAAVEDEQDYKGLPAGLRRIYQSAWVERRAEDDPWNALALATVLEDPDERNVAIRHIFTAIEGQDDGHDAVFQFAQFLDSVADAQGNPALAESLRQAIVFDVRTPGLSEDERERVALFKAGAAEANLMCVDMSDEETRLLGQVLGQLRMERYGPRNPTQITALEGMAMEAGDVMEDFRPGEEPSQSDATALVRALRLAEEAGAVDAFLSAGEAWGRENHDAPAVVRDLLEQTEGYPAQQEALLDILEGSAEYADVVEAWQNRP